MPTEFRLPDVGEGVAEGEIVAWLVEEGDTVEEDQPVAEVETDKAVVEVPSPYDGTVRELHYEEGDVVPVGDVIVTFDVEGEDVEEAEAPEPEEADEAGEPEAADESADDAAVETAEADAEAAEAPSSGGRTFAPPSVRRLARELGVDIATVSGSGPSGRITEGDVRAAAEGASEEPTETEESAAPAQAVTEVEDDEPAPEPAGEPQEAAGREKTLAAPATRRVADELDVDLNDVPATEERDGEAFVDEAAVREYAESQRAAQAADTAAVQAGESGEREERVPYRGVRRTIGEQMARSKYTAPHVTHHDTAVVDALSDVREKLKPVAEDQGFRLTYMPFIVKAVVAGLKQHPYLNSQLDEENEEIVLKNYYNIGVAVATDAGLMVPVLKNADEKSIPEIADEMRTLIEKARERSISREEMQGGTFTLTNFGAIGGEYATPIINYPETAILGLGALEERPVAEDGEVVAKETLPLSLSIDHRVIDGAVAAEFANTVQEYLENPSMLLLE